MHIRTSAAAVVAGVLLALPARAAEPKPEAFYLGFSIGNVRQKVLAPADTRDGLLGWTVGYNLNRSLAVEAYGHAYFFPSWSGLFGLPGVRTTDTDVADDHTGIAAVGAYPLGDSWRLRGRVGVGRTGVTVFAAQTGNRIGKATRTDPVLGAGIAFDPTAGWSITLDYARLTKTKADTVALGAQYRF